MARERRPETHPLLAVPEHVVAWICLYAWRIALLFDVAAHAAEPTGSVTTAAPGNPPVIVAPATMEDQVKYAVDDLRRYLRNITDLNVELRARRRRCSRATRADCSSYPDRARENSAQGLYSFSSLRQNTDRSIANR